MRRTAPRVNIRERASRFSRARFRQRPCPRATGKRKPCQSVREILVGKLLLPRVDLLPRPTFRGSRHLGLDFSDCFWVRVARENEKALRVVDGFATALLAQSAFLRRLPEKIEE